ncbi:hypothetical protein PR048_012855 [Dryococelus australis]|uniref:DUF5641 domain-containing protein n=1 Tax=Dryococelus australis TaxID=614101 RepID=A0ABQ9HS00_9NEOP|nr:hypothetical protein PR048_012855 [Dryococelus australis]
MVIEQNQDLVALTPTMFLQDIHEIGVPDCDKIESVDTKGRYRYLQSVHEDLQRRFHIEYLGQLSTKPQTKEGISLQVVQVVLVGSDHEKRQDWPLPEVQQFFCGKRHCITRVARLKTAKKKGGHYPPYSAHLSFGRKRMGGGYH